MSAPSEELVERIVTRNLAAMAGQSPQRVLKIGFAALKPGDELGEGLCVIDGYDSFPICRAEQAAARQAAEAVREAIASWVDTRFVPGLAKDIRALDIDKLLEDKGTP